MTPHGLSRFRFRPGHPKVKEFVNIFRLKVSNLEKQYK